MIQLQRKGRKLISQKSFPFSKMDILKMSKIDFPFYFWEKKFQLLQKSDLLA
jgi:hypothetical protein